MPERYILTKCTGMNGVTYHYLSYRYIVVGSGVKWYSCNKDMPLRRSRTPPNRAIEVVLHSSCLRSHAHTFAD
jgi:hypothetical protein